MEEKKNKLGLAINAFEGTEHIYNIVSEIRDLVDFVVIGLQEKSYIGDPIDKTDIAEAEKLRDEDHLVDEILYISTDSTKFSRIQETEKRNKLIDCLRENGCTHQIVIDSDEYYTHNAFQRAKEYVYDNDVEISYCRYLNYFGSGRKDDYKTYLVYPFHDGNYVPFIAKIKYKFDWQSKDFPKPSDPTRRYVRPKAYKRDEKGNIVYKDPETKKNPVYVYTVAYHEFEWNVLKMHHFSWIRNDIRKKMRDWSSRVYFHDWYELVDRAADRFEKFCQGDKEGEAVLLFNTPDNKVELCNMSKQYVFPKEDIHNRAIKQRDTMKKALAINASKRDFIDIIRVVSENQDTCQWFLLYEDAEFNGEISDKVKEIAEMSDDDSLSYSISWQKEDIGGYLADIPKKCVLVSKTTFLRMLSPDTSLIELNDHCTPLEIVGLSLRRYFENINIDFQEKEKTL